MIVYAAVAYVNPDRAFGDNSEEAFVQYEDGGMAMIVEFPTAHNNIFVRVQSYDLGCEHALDQILGKRVKVIIETMEEPS